MGEKTYRGFVYKNIGTEITVQDRQKTLAWTFQIGTAPYLVCKELMDGGDWATLNMLFQHLLVSCFIFSDEQYLKDFTALNNATVDRILSTPAEETSQSDDEILKEEQAKQKLIEENEKKN